MSNSYTKYTLPPEPQPRNRQLYAAAKAPFALLWDGFAWLGGPFGTALLLGLLVSFVATDVLAEHARFSLPYFRDAIVVGVVWGFFLGCFLTLVKLIRS